MKCHESKSPQKSIKRAFFINAKKGRVHQWTLFDLGTDINFLKYFYSNIKYVRFHFGLNTKKPGQLPGFIYRSFI